jgi:CDP-glycerol glycerophosphotransferase
VRALRRVLPRLPWAGVPLVERLRIAQHGRRLTVDVALRDGAVPVALWAHRPDTDEWWSLPAPRDSGGSHTVDVELTDLLVPLAGSSGATTVQLQVEVEEDAGVEGPDSRSHERAAPQSGAGAPARTRYRTRLGQAGSTDVGTFEPVGDEDRLQPYISRHGYLNLAVNRDVVPSGEVYVRRITVAGGVLVMRGRVQARQGTVRRAQLLLKGRSSGMRVATGVTLSLDDRRTRRGQGHRWYRFALRADFADLLGEGRLVDDVLDAWMTLVTDETEEPVNIRIGKTRFPIRLLTRPGWTWRGAQAAAITPYYTFKARKTTFQIDLFEADTLTYLRRQLRRRRLLRLVHRGRPVWLVGERPNKAQDTGFHFFRYLRRHHPEIDAYYVLDRSSPEWSNVAPLGNVLAHRSREHVRVTLVADRVLGSHHPDLLYPLRTAAFRRAVGATKVFLQHGVMGTKWMVPNYGKGRGGFKTDLFLVSSEREKEYIVSDFGYDPREVVVTGLSRFDTLFEPDVPARKQLLVIPTWRDWLQDADLYLESDFHARWSELLHHPRLREITERFGLDVAFCLHPNMQVFRPHFDDAPARVIAQGEVDIQRLVKESAMLLTDYSSVAFDFSFLHKPVAYYQFDRPRFLGALGSHLDLERELPGPISYSLDQTLDEIERVATNGMAMDPEYQRRADRFIAHRDQQNCDRIFAAVAAAKPVRAPLRTALSHELVVGAVRVFRRTPVYMPLMRGLFTVLRALPADEKKVVFESSVGTQYSDSPRYLYEELLRRGSDLTKVWAYTGKIHPSDGRTTTVERLSPGYFYHLGRAKYWVNNQNFPHYLTRRRNGVYLQTWHGTPLKRMLHDLDAIHGRTEGYVDRISRAASQWSALVSPSPYATEALRSAFRYRGPVIEQGYPRNDPLFRPDRDAVAESARRELGIADDRTVVLYAPTFRDDQTSASNRFTFRMPIDLQRFHDELGDRFVLLLRMHLLIRGAVPIPEAATSSILDVSRFPEIERLYLASDVLVTDYSSVLFDYANLRRPMVFYAYDLESYRDELRGFYLDYDNDLPGPVATTEDELFKTLGALDDVRARYATRYDAFLERFSPMDDGHAAERVVDTVFGPEGNPR